MPKMESRFEPLTAQYRLLEKFDVTISLEEQNQLEGLPSVWATLRQTIIDTELMIKQKKVCIILYLGFNTYVELGTLQGRPYEIHKRVRYRR